MTIREATINDIDNYMKVRMAVTENVLNNPALITKQDNIDYLTKHGKGWVCEINNTIVGFAIVSVVHHNVWALFVQPGFEKQNIGTTLHKIMVDWYFAQTTETLWLSTEQNTKAEKFYINRGWIATGMHSSDEVKFEMTFANWKTLSDLSK
jgi:GNAT superfamily N-acetyltransferase